MYLGLGDLTTSIAQAIAQQEGFNKPGTLAQRNNNPGNLRSGPGQTGTSGGFAVFPDAASGWSALDHQVDLNIGRGLTLQQFFAGGNGYPGYAPSADSNNPTAYANFVASQAGISASVPLNTLQLSGGDTSGFSLDPSGAYDFGGGVVAASATGGISGLGMLGIGAGLALLVWAVSR